MDFVHRMYLAPSAVEPCRALSCSPSRRSPTGIKKPKPQKYGSNKGVDPKFLRNQRFVKKGMEAKKTA